MNKFLLTINFLLGCVVVSGCANKMRNTKTDDKKTTKIASKQKIVAKKKIGDKDNKIIEDLRDYPPDYEKTPSDAEDIRL